MQQCVYITSLDKFFPVGVTDGITTNAHRRRQDSEHTRSHGDLSEAFVRV